MSNLLTIRDVCSRFSSGNSITAGDISDNDKYPVYGGNGLRGYTNSFNFDGECAIIGRQGAYCGNVKFFSGKGYMSEHAIVAVANEENDTKYLYYKLGLMDLSRYAGQSAQPGLSVETLLSVGIDVPDKKTQIDIAEVLFNIDSKISLNNSICADLENMAKLLYDYWFIQFDFPDENGKPYKSNGGKMVWNDELKREIPEGWEVKPVLKVFDWVGTSQPPKSTFSYVPKQGYVRFIQNRDYDGDSHITYIPLSNTTRVCTETDIMVDKYGDAGRTRYGIAGAYNVALSKVKVHDNIMLEYIRAYLSSNSVYEYLHSACIASTRASLNEDNFGFLSVVIPSVPILEKFNTFGHSVINQTLLKRKENQQLSSLRDFLLPMLMNGQVKIKG